MDRRRVSKGKPEDYIFPVLERGMDLELIEKRTSTFIRNTNKALNEIGTDLDLPLKLTTYVARHCFATIQKNNGADGRVISDLICSIKNHREIRQILLNSELYLNIYLIII